MAKKLSNQIAGWEHGHASQYTWNEPYLNAYVDQAGPHQLWYISIDIFGYNVNQSNGDCWDGSKGYATAKEAAEAAENKFPSMRKKAAKILAKEAKQMERELKKIRSHIEKVLK